MSAPRLTFEQLLLERGQINEEQLARARQVVAQSSGKTLMQALVGMNLASSAQILPGTLAETLDLPFERVATRDEVDPEAFAFAAA